MLVRVSKFTSPARIPQPELPQPDLPQPDLLYPFPSCPPGGSFGWQAWLILWKGSNLWIDYILPDGFSFIRKQTHPFSIHETRLVLILDQKLHVKGEVYVGISNRIRNFRRHPINSDGQNLNTWFLDLQQSHCQDYGYYNEENEADENPNNKFLSGQSIIWLHHCSDFDLIKMV
ncbi:hypothetical protein SLA2020_246090 [Shorea laevis]